MAVKGQHSRGRGRGWLLLGAALLGLAGVIFGGLALKESRAMAGEQREYGIMAASLEEEPPEEAVPAGPLKKYQRFSEQNPELYGWISLAGTVLDYPVMHTPEEPEKYLYRDFSGEESLSGAIFMDARCTDSSTNQILYGHNMKNGSMFAVLFRYEDPAYREAHPVIRFDSLWERREYEVMAVFYDRVHREDELCFKYYDFIEAESPEEYAAAVEELGRKSLYDTGVGAEYGDRLLTLSTCSYEGENDRFVVVAREKR